MSTLGCGHLWDCGENSTFLCRRVKISIGNLILINGACLERHSELYCYTKFREMGTDLLDRNLLL